MTIKMFAIMQCELCGAKARVLKNVRIEGANLQVCPQCEHYGVEISQPRVSQNKISTSGKRPAGTVPATPPVRKRRDMFDMIEGDIVDDYGDRIKHARMERGWTQKDLAMELMVRELLIKKIENNDLIPEDDIRQKLEKTLDIRLIDISEDERDNQKQKNLIPTLGDVISIKKVKK
ncbi:MAG TPA: multiprotein bridging factor aMBF1 [Methanoregulaceae archaeon]|nr:multiprotein bridging factor aMBF1 [Methanoregulaceae archaeon]